MSLPPMTGPGWYPLDLSRMFGESSAIFRRGFATLLLLGAVPAVVGASTTIALTWLYATGFLTGLVSLNPTGLAAPMLVFAGAALLTGLVSAQCGAMIVQVSIQVAGGRRPDLAVAWRETTTIVPRLLLPYLVLSAATWLAGAVGVTVLLNGLRTMVRSATDSRAAATALLTLLGAMLLAGAAGAVLTLWLQVKLFVFLPAASLEKSAGFAPARRSWQLTRGLTGVILAALLVVGLAQAVAVGLAGQLGNAFLPPAVAAGDFRGLGTLAAQLLPAIAVTTAIGAVFASFSQAFLTVMSAVVHRFRTGWPASASG
jgi:hypothetical protein